MSIIAGFITPHPPIAVPEIGRGEENKISPTLSSFERIGKEIAAIAPDTIILTSPHSIMYSDYFHISPGTKAHGDFSRFLAGSVSMTAEYDTEFTELLDSRCNRINFPAGLMGERDPALDHGTMVPLYYVNRHYTDYKLVRIGLSGLPLQTHFRLGELISETASQLNRRTVFIASGDLAHCQKEDGPYGYRPEGPLYDQRLMEALEGGDLSSLLRFDDKLLELSMECGHRSFCILAGALSGTSYSTEVLTHEATFGVGYGFAIFKAKGADQMDKPSVSKDPYVELARKTIEQYIVSGSIPSADISSIPDETPSGAFVSIHEHGMLRGCIGTFLPTRDTVSEEIIHNAISASTRDPRFSPITEDELPWLDINVDILSSPEQVSSIDDLDAKRFGVIVESKGRRGLLLPDLEGVDTPGQQISICKQKAGIPENENTLTLYRFSVIRHT